MLTSKKILATVFVSLLAISMFTFTGSGQAQYTLTVESYARHGWEGGTEGYRLTPTQQVLDPITLTVYLQDYCESGGSPQWTPASYADLVEGTKYDVKVPVSANVTWMGNVWKALFEYWEVIDVDGTSELEWPGGYLEKYVYVDYPSLGDRTTKIVPIAKGDKNKSTERVPSENPQGIA